MDVLDTPLPRLVGPATARALAGLGLRTGEDLLRHLPRRYAQRGELTDLSSLRVGEQVTISARVVRSDLRVLHPRPGQRKRRHLVEVVVTDGSATLQMAFFGQPWRVQQLAPGTEALFAGKVDAFRGTRKLTNPDVETAEDAAEFAGALVPIYPASAGVTSWQLAKAVRTVLDQLPDELPDPLPLGVRRFWRGGRVPPLAEAFRLAHRPASRDDADRARHRFRFEEAFVLQTVLAQRRRATRALPARPRVPRPGGVLDAFDARLPYALTVGQRTVGADLAHDLAQSHPMHRLLQGEVGSGKTVVALRAMLAVVDAGGQAALLAPTEVLAAQHLRSICDLLGPLAEVGQLGGDERGTRVVLLTGSQPAAARREALAAAASGEAGIVIGTHALLQDRVDFADLGLVVVDEQHRFGVEQRDALRAKADAPPHVLVMTATPIPRTVAITVFGDLEVSTLVELPPGRSPVSTHVVPAGRPGWLSRTWARVREEVEAGHRGYVVCPRIDPPEPSSVARDAAEDEPSLFGGPAEPLDDPPGAGAAVSDVVVELRGRPELAGVVVDELHGGLSGDAKDAAVRRFAAGEVQVLVATTVVEVGVDVPEATVMVVLDADRFGVSQLHQLRGRVGRGTAPGVCLLVTRAEEGSAARARVDSVAATTDGFELARLDLEQRREGDVLGASQSGLRSSLRVLAVVRDEEVIRIARDAASAVVEDDPDLVRAPALARAVADLVRDEDEPDDGVRRSGSRTDSRADYLAKA